MGTKEKLPAGCSLLGLVFLPPSSYKSFVQPQMCCLQEGSSPGRAAGAQQLHGELRASCPGARKQGRTQLNLHVAQWG